MNYYSVDTLTYSDYYPFGMLMPNRHGQEDDYRYGFNGMEKDDEVRGTKGASYDFGARMLDVRIGRWLSVDPLAGKQPGWSTYKSFLDNPVYWIDPDGRTERNKIVYINKITGTTIIKISDPISEKIISKIATEYLPLSADEPPVRVNAWFDFNNVTTITIDVDADVNQTSTTSFTTKTVGTAKTTTFANSETYARSKISLLW
tara:strand:- start:2250 stop:2858 length:609 start_codon:yes stop_codon:yes gene_type:complete